MLFQDPLTYYLESDSGPSGSQSMNFFRIESKTGEIYLRRPLTESTLTRFTVSIKQIFPVALYRNVRILETLFSHLCRKPKSLNLLIFQMFARIADIGPPSRSARVAVTVNVIRDQRPFFVNPPFRATTQEILSVGASVISVQARDTDSAVRLLILSA